MSEDKTKAGQSTLRGAREALSMSQILAENARLKKINERLVEALRDAAVAALKEAQAMQVGATVEQAIYHAVKSVARTAIAAAKERG